MVRTKEIAQEHLKAARIQLDTILGKMLSKKESHNLRSSLTRLSVAIIVECFWMLRR